MGSPLTTARVKSASNRMTWVGWVISLTLFLGIKLPCMDMSEGTFSSMFLSRRTARSLNTWPPLQLLTSKRQEHRYGGLDPVTPVVVGELVLIGTVKSVKNRQFTIITGDLENRG
jgi:hypothetical protein